MSENKSLGGFSELDEHSINTIRFLAVDGVDKAKSGHPGMPMGDAPMAYVLWTRFLRHNPKDPRWQARDRFVLSAGHGSMLLYSLLHLTGYDLSMEDLKDFRQWGSHTPGHPEYDPERGIETTTGPLGQGFANGVGMAIAQRYLAGHFNRPDHELFDYNIYAITSDGDMMEGVSSEAASIAGHLGLGSIVYLYSDNKITIEGSTDITFTEDVAGRFEAMGWHVLKIDGNDLNAIEAAIEAGRGERDRPSLIVARTNIGFGSPAMQDTAAVHGSPLGADETRHSKEKLGWPVEPTFHVPEEVAANFRTAEKRGGELECEWNKLLSSYRAAYQDVAAELDSFMAGPSGGGGDWAAELPAFEPGDGPMATRSASGKVLNAIAAKAPFLIGGSADLAPSNNTELKGMGNLDTKTIGRNLHFGVREHAMGSILNGMALTGGFVPYGATFLIFSDYMRPPMRLAALMGLHVVYVFTHDSVGLGEDGPTHQPIEQLASLRAVPNLTVIRPADAAETAEAWRVALTNDKGPVALVLTRQKLEIIDRSVYGPASALERGAYLLADPDKADVIIIATGSEVELALGACTLLKERGVTARLVSMPSWELFEAQDAAYRDSVLTPGVPRVSVEAGSTFGWHRYVLDGETIGIERFGASAPYKVIFEKFGLTVENVANKAVALVERNKKKQG